MGRPPVDTKEIAARVEGRVVTALDAYALSAGPLMTRPQAIRTILADWLTGHGFLKHRDDAEGAN